MGLKQDYQRTIRFSSRILKFKKKGEKTGWTYIEIPADLAVKLMPGNKKSFRVKGSLDAHVISKVALLPMGGGDFIMPLNAAMRKAIGKREGSIVKVVLQCDKQELTVNADFLKCLNDEPEALAGFNALAKSHQNYFSKWIDAAKGEETKAKRIARAIDALLRKMNYAEMLRAGRERY